MQYSDDFFDSVDYKGAFGNENLWLKQWWHCEREACDGGSGRFDNLLPPDYPTLKSQEL